MFKEINNINLILDSKLKSDNITFTEDGKLKSEIAISGITALKTEEIKRECGEFFFRNSYGVSLLPQKRKSFKIQKVIFNLKKKATTVMWIDGDVTVVRCGKDEVFSKELGIAFAFVKRAHENSTQANKTIAKWVKEGEEIPKVKKERK